MEEPTPPPPPPPPLNDELGNPFGSQAHERFMREQKIQMYAVMALAILVGATLILKALHIF